MPPRKPSKPAVPAITQPTEPTQPPARAGPPEPSNPDNPWGLKDTFRWLVSLLRSHNALLDSHIELQRTVTDLRQNILELARLPITAPIWCDPGIETVIRPPEEPLFPPDPNQRSEQVQPEETENTLLDKGPMESQAWTDENSRQALEKAQLHEAIRQSKQPQFPPDAPTSQHPTAASTTGTDVSPHGHTSPPDHRTSKQSRTPKATQHTPVKAMPPNRPAQINRTAKQQTKHTPAEPHTPAPKKRRIKTTPVELHNQHTTEDNYTDDIDLSAEAAIFEQFAEEESPKHTSPEFEGPVEPVAPPKKKRRKQ